MARHLGIIREFGLNAVVAVNRFPDDTDDEIELVRRLALEHGAYAAEVNDGVAQGRRRGGRAGRGGRRRRRRAVELRTPSTRSTHSIEEKIEAIAKRVYGADGIFLFQPAREKIAQFNETGLDRLPICMAKTHLSLSHDPTLTNAPTGFTVTVRDIRAYTGAGWLVALCGDMQTMPGLGARRPPPSTSTSTPREGPLGSSNIRPRSTCRRRRAGVVPQRLEGLRTQSGEGDRERRRRTSRAPS